ncbi:hypothetical protein H5410_031956 [Solanum commersonii]|uniref:Uncharacterized protein n=1 Tax=Solanum commersonii TaxID=4109 RepID=A0A9J5YJP5_SOLCO|nr:hypothetical protein H5410_031956 [Solanum commersonii]
MSNEPRSRKNPSICRFSCAIVYQFFLVFHNSDIFFAEIFHGPPRRPSYGVSCPRWLKQPIFKVKGAPEQLVTMAKTSHFQSEMSPTVVNGIFGDLELRCHLGQIFSWTSVITLAMEPVGPDRQNGPFSRSNDPLSRPYLGSELAMTAKPSQFQGQMSLRAEFLCHFCQIFSWTSMKTLATEPVGHDSQNGPFSRTNKPQRHPLRPYIWSQLVTTAKTTHFHSQTSPTVAMELVGHHGQNDPFCRSNEPHMDIRLDLSH